MSETPTNKDTGSLEPVNAPEDTPASGTEAIAEEPNFPQEPYYYYPGEVQRYGQVRKQRGGLGCWIVGMLTALLTAGLVVAGLLLPPFNLAERIFPAEYTMFNAAGNADQTDDGHFRVFVDPANPGEEFGVLLDTVSMNDFMAGNGGDTTWVASASAATPPYLAAQSPLYTIETTGTAPNVTLLEIARPQSASPDVLDLYGWYADSNTWRFIPTQANVNGGLNAEVKNIPDGVALFQAAPLDPVVLTTLDETQNLSTEIANLATIISPAGMQPIPPGVTQSTLAGNPAPGFDVNAAYQVMPIVRNFTDPRATDLESIIAIISNPGWRQQHINELAAFATSGSYDGLFIDYRDIPADQRDSFTALIAELGAVMHELNLSLGVVVPAADNVAGSWDTGAYNWRALGGAADYVLINFDLDPTNFIPGRDRLVEAMLRWGVGEVSRYKLLGGLSALSTRQAAGDFTTIGYDEALSALGNVVIDVEETDAGTVPPGSEIRISLDGFDAVPGVDTNINAPYIDYMSGGNATSRVWLTTGEALRFRMDRMRAFGLVGVAFDDLLTSGVADGVDNAILDYKLQSPGSPSQAELVLNWRIEGADGAITEFTTDFNENPVITLSAPDGNYAVNVDVVGGSEASSRGGVAIALFAPTPTPTPLPTATPTPTPTLTPTLVPVIPTQAAAPSNPSAPQGGGVPAAPGAGSIGAFEYGGHVTTAGSDRAANAMRTAGMSWMKVQIRYSPGAGTGGVAGEISAARARGFHILLGIVGYPADLAAGGGGYIQQFASFLGDVATLGPDAIEVWNEPNLDREWPNGQISGANYVALLSQAYQAIKSRNSSVIVISGALAPTGAEGAYPGAVVNDDRFLADMVAAGGLNYMDCVGMHYNEGTVGPTATGGDFRDNYYTRYLPTMLNTYASITGGQKPICITELGYLTSEGYGPLPGFFAWAEGNTLAEHAAWLAQAAAFASQSGRVRLMIVWNVDFTVYGADPMAGYAIIRVDGSCPACSALAGAR